MSSFKIKLYGLSDIDKRSLVSMLKIAKKQLIHDWDLVQDGLADLSIYNFDSEEGRLAWNDREYDSASASFSLTDTKPDTVDYILKKPLRSKNFSAALNSLSATLHDVDTDILDTKKSASTTSSTLFNTLSNRFTTKNQPASDLPALNFSLPALDEIEAETILTPEQLQQWLRELADMAINSAIKAIVESLIILNRTDISYNKRLVLLEIYRKPIHSLLLNHTSRSAGKKEASHSDYLHTIHTFELLIKEFGIGYQLLINESYQQGERPQENLLYLSTINRFAETISLSILHAYHYYLSPPPEAIVNLHQLYIYCEAGNSLHTIINSNQAPSSDSFAHIYSQIMLTNIADPYRLSQDEIVALHTLMGRYADKVDISPLTELSDDSLTHGYFYLDCLSDKLPSSLINSSAKQHHASSARLLNTEAVLKAVELDLKTEESVTTQPKLEAINIAFLKKITPQINASYERQFKRAPSTEKNKLNLALGIKSINQGISKNHTSKFSQWTIQNKGMGGMMVSSHDVDCFQLNIGDLVGVFPDDSTTSMAVIRWLHTADETTHMGLESYSGTPISITVITENHMVLPGLLLSNANNIQFENTLIVEQAIFHANHRLRISENGKTYGITANRLIETSPFYERFSFNLRAST